MATNTFDLDRIVKLAIVALCLVMITDVVARRLSGPSAAPATRDDGRSRAAQAGTPPDAPLPDQPISLENAAIDGLAEAPIVILGYTDFQCPFCAVFAKTILPTIKKEFIETGQVRLVLKHLPLDVLHPQARRIAVAAECTRQLGQFWPFHDLAFARQKELATIDVVELARQAGVSAPEFPGCVDAGAAAGAVSRDAEEAASLGVNGTPTFFVGRGRDGVGLVAVRRLVGAQSVEAFRAAIGAAAR